MGAGRILIATIAILATSGCGHKAGPALSGGKPPNYWVKNISSPDKKIRREAVAKLGNLGAADPDVLPALTTALHDADSQIRGDAVLAIAKLGRDAKPAIPDLEAISKRDLDATVRDYATRTLEKLR
jgi:HEAT repeat protein